MRILILLLTSFVISGCIPEKIVYVNHYIIEKVPETLLEKFPVPTPVNLSSFNTGLACYSQSATHDSIELYVQSLMTTTTVWSEYHDAVVKHNSMIDAIKQWQVEQDQNYDQSTLLNKDL